MNTKVQKIKKIRKKSLNTIKRSRYSIKQYKSIVIQDLSDTMSFESLLECFEPNLNTESSDLEEINYIEYCAILNFASLKTEIDQCQKLVLETCSGPQKNNYIELTKQKMSNYYNIPQYKIYFVENVQLRETHSNKATFGCNFNLYSGFIVNGIEEGFAYIRSTTPYS